MRIKEHLKVVWVLLLANVLFVSSCNFKNKDVPSNDKSESDQSTAKMEAPDWTKKANIYEVNIRQYTTEGTFNAFRNHLPRLQELGIDILWLMPIHPIGVKNRKGGMGSPYSIKDYMAINPDFGNAADLKTLIDEVHSRGMKIILDWVPNHSSFDNQWTVDHPEWYTKDENGNITHPKDTDWTDVADLNYNDNAMRAEMTISMAYWVTEYDIDGFRCDVAGKVPTDFWITNNTILQGLKHLFLLAEWDDPELHVGGFHMTYGWGFHHVMNHIAQGKNDASEIDSFLMTDSEKFNPRDYRMNFITNHDENSWNGTIEERMGKAGDAFAVIAFTIQGMPLIYGGQEAGLHKRLSFFDKDQIDWSNIKKESFYKKLISLKHNNEALWNGDYGGKLEKLETDSDPNIYAYSRKKNSSEVIVVLNLSNQNETFSFNNKSDFSKKGIFENIFNGDKIEMSTYGESKHSLKPWDFQIWSKNQ